MNTALTLSTSKTLAKNTTKLANQQLKLSKTLSLSHFHFNPITPHHNLGIKCTQSQDARQSKNAFQANKSHAWPKAAMVGASVVLACALGATQMKHAAAFAGPGGGPPGLGSTTTIQQGVDIIQGGGNPDGGAMQPGAIDNTIDTLREMMFKKEEYLSPLLVFSEVLQLTMKNDSVPLGLMKMIFDTVPQEFQGFANQGTGKVDQKPLNLLHNRWLADRKNKKELGLLLVQIYIHQKDFNKARDVIEKVIADHGEAMSDPRPYLQKAVIWMMLAVETMLNDPDKTSIEDIKDCTEEAMNSWIEFQNKYEIYARKGYPER